MYYANRITNLDKWFWINVNKNGPIPSHVPDLGPCWEWTGKSIREGYGYVRWNHKQQGTHCISWEIHFGPIEKGKWCLHKCDNRLCVRPTHLFIGNHKDNMRDCRSKQRQEMGERHHYAKLKESQVLEIRFRFSRHESVHILAKEFNVTTFNIYMITSGRTWKHLPQTKPEAALALKY